MSGSTRTLTEQYMFRMPEGMRERIKAEAERNGRSMNSELLATVSARYPPHAAAVATASSAAECSPAHAALLEHRELLVSAMNKAQGDVSMLQHMIGHLDACLAERGLE